MALSTCTISGSLVTPDGVAISGATIKAVSVKPVLYTDGTLIMNYEISTTSDATGAWSLTLVETASTSSTITVSITDPTLSNDRKDYTITVPNTTTATFASLITGQ